MRVQQHPGHNKNRKNNLIKGIDQQGVKSRAKKELQRKKPNRGYLKQPNIKYSNRGDAFARHATLLRSNEIPIVVQFVSHEDNDEGTDET